MENKRGNPNSSITRDYDAIVSTSQALPGTDWREEPYTLNLQDINYTVGERRGRWWQGACLRPVIKKEVLNDVTLQIKSGELTAFLGSSGSGKTSLLDTIACRTEGELTGKMTLNQFECTTDFMRQSIAYVIQTDRLLHTLTVTETLTYAALLRLPGNTSTDDLKQKVNTVIQRMGLNPVKHSKIGGLIDRGISGGEKRRVTIAIQLLRDPAILLLDEPTTGLDSYTARHLVKNLAELAHSGKMVILSIHQPRYDIFGLLDKVALLSAGSMVYYGGAHQMVDYFTLAGYPCPRFANPLDHYVDVASIDRRTREQEMETSHKVDKLIRIYKESLIFDDIRHDVMQLTTQSHRDDKSMKIIQEHLPTVFRVMWTLLRRCFRHTGRDRSTYLSRLFLNLVSSPFIFMFLIQIGTDPRSVQDRVGLIYQSTSIPSYVGLLNAFYLFPSLRDLYYREAMDGLYSPVTFILAYALYVVPFHIFSTALFSIVVYWITGMYNDWIKYAMFNAVLTLLQFVYEILTVGALGVFMDSRLAINATTLILIFGYLVSSGLIRRMDSMLDILQWLSYAGVYKYTSRILAVNEFEDLVFDCSNSSSKADPCQYPTGKLFLDAYFPDAMGSMHRDAGILSGFVGVFLIVTMLAYKFRGSRTLH